MIETLIEPWFVFALIWSVGGTCDGDGRKKFSEFLRKKMDDEQVMLKSSVKLVLTSDQFDVKLSFLYASSLLDSGRGTCLQVTARGLSLQFQNEFKWKKHGLSSHMSDPERELARCVITFCEVRRAVPQSEASEITQ